MAHLKNMSCFVVFVVFQFYMGNSKSARKIDTKKYNNLTI